ncbi:hypothetical protein [Clavibacter sp.]|uniref:hypothetical protein n=1 Tax=Clavibacter sp. TaxID=1871044 RepID=UPI0019B56F4D|nr:hypothetical protein [Clavibacter sp.]MBD5381913.1 hypothetical protein [Clavibacter sp.]
MRIKVNINNPKEERDMESFQLWIEKHADGVKDFFMAGAPHREGLVFQFIFRM